MIIKRPLLWMAGSFISGELIILMPEAFLLTGFPVTLAVFGSSLRRKQPFSRRKDLQKKYSTKEKRQKRLIRLLLPFCFFLGMMRIFMAQNVNYRLDAVFLEKETDTITASVTGTITQMERKKAAGDETAVWEILLKDPVIREGQSESREENRAEKEAESREENGEENRAEPYLLLVKTQEDLSSYREGNVIRAVGRINRMETAANPGAFDSASYYRAKKIGYTMKAVSVSCKEKKTSWAAYVLRLFRQALEENLDVCGGSDAGTFRAMILGEKWAGDEARLALYQSVGIGHLLAISGLHVSLIGMGVYSLLRKRLRCSYRLCSGICMSVTLLYYIVAGRAVSAARAGIMMGCFLVSAALGKRSDMLSSAALAALLLLLDSPLLILQSSFLYSFLCILALAMMGELFPETIIRESREAEQKNAEHRKAKKRMGLRILLPGIAIFLTVLPLQAVTSYEVPLFGIFLNLIVIPLFTPVVLLATLAALLGGFLPGLASVWLLPARWILQLFDLMGNMVLKIPFAIWKTGRPSDMRVIVYVSLLLLLSCGKKKWARLGISIPTNRMKHVNRILAGSFLLLPLCFLRTGTKELEILQLDVGQGDCALIRIPGDVTLLVDCGSSTDRLPGENVVLPILKYYAIETIDYAFVTHGDADHMNGVRELLEADRIENLILPKGEAGETQVLKELRLLAAEHEAEVFLFAKGDEMTVGDVTIDCLWPEKQTGEMEENEASLTFLLRYGAFEELFTGDLEGMGEMAVSLYLEQTGKRADVLKAAHHGSAGTGSERFLAAVRPKLSVISSGFGNRYGHPSEEAVNRLLAAGSMILRTDHSGAVCIRTDGREMIFFGWKDGERVAP